MRQGLSGLSSLPGTEKLQRIGHKEGNPAPEQPSSAEPCAAIAQLSVPEGSTGNHRAAWRSRPTGELKGNAAAGCIEGRCGLVRCRRLCYERLAQREPLASRPLEWRATRAAPLRRRSALFGPSLCNSSQSALFVRSCGLSTERTRCSSILENAHQTCDFHRCAAYNRAQPVSLLRSPPCGTLHAGLATACRATPQGPDASAAHTTAAVLLLPFS